MLLGPSDSGSLHQSGRGMRSVRRVGHLAPCLFLLQGHRKKRELQVFVLQWQDVREVFFLQRHRTNGTGTESRRSAIDQCVRLLQRPWDIQPHLLLLQRHRQKRKLQVSDLQREDVFKMLQLQRLGPAALAKSLARTAVA